MPFLSKKLEIPSNAKPIKPVIIVLKIPLLLFCPLGNLGNIKSTHSLICDVWSCYRLLPTFYRTPCMALILHNTRADPLYYL